MAGSTEAKVDVARTMKRLALAAVVVFCTTIGCTTTMTYDLSDPIDRRALTKEESARIDFVDGTQISVRNVGLSPDSVFFAVKTAENRRSSAALSEVAQVTATRSSPGKTLALVGASILVVFVSTFVFWAATFVD